MLGPDMAITVGKTWPFAFVWGSRSMPYASRVSSGFKRGHQDSLSQNVIEIMQRLYANTSSILHRVVNVHGMLGSYDLASAFSLEL